jgi:predicted acetyltransferase
MIPTMSHITNPHITIHFIMSHPIRPTTTNHPIMIHFIMNPLTHLTTNHIMNHIIGKSIRIQGNIT